MDLLSTGFDRWLRRGPAWLAVLSCCAALLWPAASRAVPEPLAVIVASGSPLQQVSLTELRNLYMGLSQRVQGHKVIPLNQATGVPGRQAFDRRVLGMSPDAAGRYWIGRRIRGEGRPPRSVGSERLVARVVARLPGAIGYVAVSQVVPGVRALAVDGKTPSSPGYPLAP